MSRLLTMTCGLILLATSAANAAEVVCVFYKMYPVPGGYMCYAVRHTDPGCVQGSATAYIGNPTVPQTPCVNCIGLGGFLALEPEPEPADGDDLQAFPAQAVAPERLLAAAPASSQLPEGYDGQTDLQPQAKGRIHTTFPVEYARAYFEEGKESFEFDLACHRFLMIHTETVEIDGVSTEVHTTRLMAFAVPAVIPIDPETGKEIEVATLQNFKRATAWADPDPDLENAGRWGVPSKGVFTATLPSKGTTAKDTPLVILTGEK